MKEADDLTRSEVGLYIVYSELESAATCPIDAAGVAGGLVVSWGDQTAHHLWLRADTLRKCVDSRHADRRSQTAGC